jgi:hypothetical protein
VLLRFARLLAGLLKRLYALAAIVVIFWLTYNAFRYLIDSLLIPTRAPGQITALPRRLDEALLRGRRPDWLGLAAVEHPRSPLSHYHRFDTWIQADPMNDCTRSGCHGPLPHAKRKEVRAFLNMHATTLHCGVCHMQSDDVPLPLVWYDLERGRVRNAPALLRSLDWLATRQPPADDAAARAQQRQIVALLRQAAQEAGGDAALSRLAEHLHAVRAASPAFERLLTSATETVQRSLRGLYGAKLALRSQTGGLPLLGHPGTESAVQRYLVERDQASEERKRELLAAVHPRRRSEPLTCAACHRDHPSHVDLAALGYPPARVEALTDPVVVRMIEHIAQGHPFHLPRVMEPRDGAPAP